MKVIFCGKIVQCWHDSLNYCFDKTESEIKIYEKIFVLLLFVFTYFKTVWVKKVCPEIGSKGHKIIYGKNRRIIC